MTQPLAPSPAPTARGEQTRQALLRAAAEVFARKGVEGASILDIAKAAQTASGTLYRHFDSKDALARAAYLEGKRRVAAMLWEDFPFDLPVRAAFREAWGRLTAAVVEDTSLFVFLDLRLHGSYLDPEEIAQVEAASFAPLVEMLQRGQAEEVVVEGDLGMLARFIGGAFIGAARAALRPDGSVDKAFMEAAESLAFASIRR